VEYVDVFELRSEEDEEDDDLIPNQYRHNYCLFINKNAIFCKLYLYYII